MNYWLTPLNENKHISELNIDFGCNAEITGIILKNTHNAHWNDFSTKDFRFFIRRWDSFAKARVYEGTLPNPLDMVRTASRHQSELMFYRSVRFLQLN